MSFLCALGALDTAGEDLKEAVLKFAVSQVIPEHELLDALSRGDRDSKLKGCLRALALRCVQAVTIFVALGVGCRESVAKETTREAFKLGVSSRSVELLTALFEAAPLPEVDVSAATLLQRLAVEEQSADLAIIACACREPCFEQRQRMDLLDLALNTASARLALLACQAGALEQADKGKLLNVLQLAFDKDSAALALLVCKQDTFPSTCMFRSTNSAHDIMMIMQFAARTASVELVTLAVQFGCSFESAIAARRRGPLVGSEEKVKKSILRLGLEQKSLKLVLPACQSGALVNAPSDARFAALQIALQKESSELALHAVRAFGPGTLVLEVDSDTINRALQLGILSSSTDLLLALCEGGALQHGVGEVKKAVLDQAAVSGDLQLADLCISNGALQAADGWSHPTPVDIAEQGGYSRLAAKLNQALNSHKLLSAGQCDANTVLVRVAGPPGAGKSTLVDSMKTTRFWSYFRGESQDDEGDENFHMRTRGIQVHTHEDADQIRYRILDLGGQEDFTAANQLFVGQGRVSAINMIVVSSLDSPSNMEEEVLNRSSFFASRNGKMLLPNSQAIQLVFQAFKLQ